MLVRTALASLLLVGGASASDATTIADDPARLVPADTLLYFGTHSVREGAQASRASAMSMILGEPEVKAFLQQPIAMADQVMANLAEMAAGMNDTGLEIPAEGMSVSSLFDNSGDGPPLGQMFMALTHLDLPQGAGLPDIGLVVGIELLEAEDVGMLKQLWDSIPVPTEESTYAGHTVLSKPTEEGFTPMMAVVGNMAVVSTSERTLHAVLDRSGGAADSLASSSAYRSMLGAAGGTQPGASTHFVRVAPMMQLAKTGIGIMLVQEGDYELVPKVNSLIDGLGIEANEWVGGVSFRDQDGMVNTTAVSAMDPSAPGLVNKLTGMTRPLDMSRLEAMPADAMSVTGASVAGLGELYDYIAGAVESLMPPEDYAEMAAEIGPMFEGIDVRNDILANIEGSSWSYAMPGLAFMGQPANFASLEMKDPGAFVDALEKLLPALNAMAAEAMGAPGGLEFKRGMHGDVEFIELDVSKSPMLAMTMMSPALAIKDGQLWVCLESASALKDQLNGEVGSGSVTDDPNLALFLERLERDGEITSVTYSDAAQTFGVMYQQIVGPMQMMGGAMADIPVDLSLMPSEQAIGQHLGNTWSGSTISEDGSMIINRSVAHFEVMDFMPLAATVGLVAFAVQEGMASSIEVVAEEPPEEIARGDIAQLRAGLTVYKISQGSYPDTLDELTRPLPDYENGCLNRPDLPVDPWGNAYLYVIDGRKAKVWSAGPDGIDNGGEGDDITRR